MSAGTGSDETWVSPPPGKSGGLRVAVAYPGSYWVGMSNLGYQAVLRTFLEKPGFDVRRIFWEEGKLHFPDGGINLSEFDVIAFSVSYQPDLVHLPRMLKTGRAASGDRASSPLIIGGGIALTINPEPAAPFMDVVVIGDSEPVLPIMQGLIEDRASRRDREYLLERIGMIRGVYIPSRYTPSDSDDIRCAIPVPNPGAPSSIKAAICDDLDEMPARPAVVAEKTEFGSLYLLEVSRGCGAKCSFCAASAACGPTRFLGLDAFGREMEKGLRYRRKIGLVGTAVSYHPGLLDLAGMIHKAGGTFSPSSIRLEKLNPEFARLLASSGNRTVSMAPETGTEQLRLALGKGFMNREVLEKTDILLEAGINNVKLYFMVGLPGEDDGDAAAVVDLTAQVRNRMVNTGRKRGAVGTVTVSVNPFVPKPGTPMEREPMAREDTLKRRMRIIRDGLGRLGGVRVHLGSVRISYLDAVVSLGDRTVAGVLEELPRRGLSFKRLSVIVPGVEDMLFGRESGRLPWEMIRH